MNGNIPTVNEQGKKVCVQASPSLWVMSATTFGIRFAKQSAVSVTGPGVDETPRRGGETLWHVTWAAASAVALGTAEVTGQFLHSHCLLIRLAASAWVVVVGGVGRDSHLQLCQMNECCLPVCKEKDQNAP